MPRDRTVPTRNSTTARPRSRLQRAARADRRNARRRRPGVGAVRDQPRSQPPVCARAERHLPGLAPAHYLQPPVKVLLVRTVQRYTINPLMRLLLAVGINPLGVAILETRGHVSGKTRRVPVGNGRKGDSFWIIAEHGTRAGYVRNIEHDPHVRVRLRIGLRYRWVPGIATVCPDDDPLARQRQIIAWHPLRALNAVNVRVLGADLLTVHVQLSTAQAGDSGRPVLTDGRPARDTSLGTRAEEPRWTSRPECLP